LPDLSPQLISVVEFTSILLRDLATFLACTLASIEQRIVQLLHLMNTLLDQLERKFSQWAIPGLIRYLTILFVGVFLLTALNPAFADTLDFDYPKILDGEWWRLLTFIFASHVGSFDWLSILFLFFGTMLLFIFGDGLEQQWGVFRTNLFVYWGIISALAANLLLAIVFKQPSSMSAIYLISSIFFAFATYNPRYTLMLMLIIPCPIWVLAALSGGLMVLGTLGSLLSFLFLVICLSNYLFVAIPMFISHLKNRSSTQVRRKLHSRQFSNKQEAFHTCHSCGANEITHPDAEFRVSQDGNDYCTDHLPKS
jgi:hypothetical protein